MRFATLSVRQLRAGKYFESLFCGTEEQTTVYPNVEKRGNLRLVLLEAKKV
jgi:hypothetical protein